MGSSANVTDSVVAACITNNSTARDQHLYGGSHHCDGDSCSNSNIATFASCSGGAINRLSGLEELLIKARRQAHDQNTEIDVQKENISDGEEKMEKVKREQEREL